MSWGLRRLRDSRLLDIQPKRELLADRIPPGCDLIEVVAEPSDVGRVYDVKAGAVVVPSAPRVRGSLLDQLTRELAARTGTAITIEEMTAGLATSVTAAKTGGVAITPVVDAGPVR